VFRYFALGMLAFLALVGGCHHAPERAMQSENQVNTVAAGWITMLRSPNQVDFAHACQGLHSLGRAAVPSLLATAIDSSAVSWSPPLFPGCSLLRSRLSVGDVCLHLLEGIRVSELVHSYTPAYHCDGLADQATCAVEEYRRWWNSLQQVDGEPYVPKVSWNKVRPESRQQYTDENGQPPQADYLPVLGSERRREASD
jgi:hypothetical protein